MANPSGALTGLPAVYGADIYDSGTAQKFQLGTLGFGFGGNKAFRYGRNNASTASVALLILGPEIQRVLSCCAEE